jgi:hypothetical protein
MINNRPPSLMPSPTHSDARRKQQVTISQKNIREKKSLEEEKQIQRERGQNSKFNDKQQLTFFLSQSPSHSTRKATNYLQQ